MIFLLYGEDSFRRTERLKELITPYRAKYSDLDMISLDLEDEPDGWRRVRDFLNQPSMFVDSKVAIVKEATSVREKEWAATLKSFLNVPKTFIFISQREAPVGDFSFLLAPPVKSQQFGSLLLRELEAFIKDKAAKLGLEFSADAFRFLSLYIGSSTEKTALASYELEKISLMGFKNPIALEDLKKAVVWQPGTAAYALSAEILAARDFRRRLAPLEKILLSEDPYYAFNSLGFQARGAQAALLAEYDISVKSGGLEYEEALTDFVVGN
ncbi:MAG TPA: hypothetical protein VNK70_02180 [Candidatus Paceibacterota bacterium]|nr:hypothetical protein [Candidatus Paceibacterota bacterium]